MENSRGGLPIFSLLCLSTTAFLTILTETMPAAVLPLMASDLERSSAEIGMLVGAYASGAAVASIPIIAATRAIPRRMLFVLALGVFCAANVVTAISSSYAIIFAARVVAGITSGVVWPMVAGYAVRLASREDMGRAISIAMTGSAVAMAIGLPIGSYLGEALGWRASFGLLALMALVLIGWVMASIPAVAPTPKERRTSVRRVALLPGQPLVLTMCGVAMFGHYSLYTYIAPLALELRLDGGATTALLLFGTGAIIGVVLAGRLVDRHLRRFALAAVSLTVIAMIWTLSAGQHPFSGMIAVFLWGLSFGGMPTVIQSASSRIAGEETELATAMIATIYNAGIFSGAAAGGLALSTLGMSAVLWLVLAAMAISFALVSAGARQAFPRSS